MMDSGLKIYGFIEIPSSGYQGEEVGSTNGTPATPGPEGQVNPFTSTYFYRDSQNGTNSRSTRVDVTIRQEYTYKQTTGNHYHIKVKGWLTSIVRGSKNTTGGAIAQNPTRTIQVWGVNGQSVFGPTASSPASEGTIFSGNAFLGENEYDLGPGEKTDLKALSADYRSYTTGYWTGAIPSKYLDQMHMGLMFENTLPDECDPPKLISVTQADDICENEVEACLTFEPCSCEGMALYLEYHFNGESWEDAKAKGQVWQVNASHTSRNTICLQHLPPTNHTWSPVVLYWRAKYIPVATTMPETAFVEGNSQIIFILHPHETVPDISPQECAMLQRGDLIGKYEEEVCYNEFSCADMAVKNPSREKDVEECKKVNGVIENGS